MDQCKVLLVNEYLNIQSLPYEVLTTLKKLQPPIGCIEGTSLAAQVLSAFSRIPAKTIDKTYWLVKQAEWYPSRHGFPFLGGGGAHGGSPYLI